MANDSVWHVRKLSIAEIPVHVPVIQIDFVCITIRRCFNVELFYESYTHLNL